MCLLLLKKKDSSLFHAKATKAEIPWRLCRYFFDFYIVRAHD